MSHEDVQILCLRKNRNGKEKKDGMRLRRLKMPLKRLWILFCGAGEASGCHGARVTWFSSQHIWWAPEPHPFTSTGRG
jgi:hypothetical protein